MSKLCKIGLSEMSLNWFTSYLDRRQELTFNEITSECITVKSGIGQGTIVGPMILLLDIHDVVKSLPDVHINMYADDCILYTTGNTRNQVHACLQYGLFCFDEWCPNNSMILNICKSKCLIIGNRNKLSNIDYELKLQVRNTSLDFDLNFPI